VGGEIFDLGGEIYVSLGLGIAPASILKLPSNRACPRVAQRFRPGRIGCTKSMFGRPILSRISSVRRATEETPSVHIGDMPHWMGGLPADASLPPGTLEYDAWMD
jgi:hypothetical protein